MWLSEETKRNLPKELDFLQEGKNCEQVERLFKHFTFLKVSEILKSYANITVTGFVNSELPILPFQY